ncbi:MAG: OsmC family protein [Flavobacteriales bacterium]
MNKMMGVSYDGGLRCFATHIKSGVTTMTDAPPDNHGKGESFSPTDLLCTSLACCMISIMGITADQKEIALGHIEADIEKIMASNPRRVEEIKIHLRIKNLNYGERERSILENAAKTCPVAKSLSAELLQTLSFEYV